jgi:transcription elongation factor GreA
MQSSRIFIVGSGVVGAATGEGFLAAGHKVTFIDVSAPRVAELEAKLGNAQVIDPKLVDAEGRCVFGATVDVEDEAGEASTWQIVGEDEADIKAGRLSYTSPIARALIGKSEGDVVSVNTPGGAKSLEIIAVRYV